MKKLFFFQAEDGIRDIGVTGVQTCALPIFRLFANILAGHLLILFMAGGLAVILGLSALGVVTLPVAIVFFLFEVGLVATLQDRKSTRLNSSHANISYAVFCLKKKKKLILYRHQ